MSAAPAVATAPAKGGGKKKLVIIGAALAVLLVAGGGGTWFLMKKRATAAAAALAEDGEGAEAKSEAKAAKAELKDAPTFVPLDPFTVNLADREAERYAQVGMTLELTDAKAGDLLKAYMPAIRNNILLVLSSKTAGQLMEHDGKLLLAAQVRATALKPLGYHVPVPVDAVAAAAPPTTASTDGTPPIRAVHFSNFIIQ